MTGEAKKNSLSEVSSVPRTVHPKIIAAIPCLDTELFIKDVITKARKYVDEVIVIDDGSQDNTAKVAKAAGALVISHGVNKGYGEAIKSCFIAARANKADILITIDGDGQHNPDEIPYVLAPIFQENADLVIGSRFLHNEHSVPRYRKFGISIITFLWNLGSKMKVTDSQSGFRAYSKRLIDNLSLSESGMSISIEVLEKISRMKPIVVEVPITCRYSHSPLNLQAFCHGFGVAFSVFKILVKNSLAAPATRATNPSGDSQAQANVRNPR